MSSGRSSRRRWSLCVPRLNKTLGRSLEEWEIPWAAADPWQSAARDLFLQLKAEQSKAKDARDKRLRELLNGLNEILKRNYTLEDLPERPVDPWPDAAQKLHAAWWEQR